MVDPISPARHDPVKNDINYFFIILFNMKSYIFSSNLMILNIFNLKHTIYGKNKYMKVYSGFEPGRHGRAHQAADSAQPA
jgi:hypothetical protein